jgi:hypothetical protein
MGQVAEIVLSAVIEFCFGMAPERPLWLRRVVQVFWAVLVVLVLIVCGFGLVMLIEAL